MDRNPAPDPLFDLSVPLEDLGLGSASPVGGEAAAENQVLSFGIQTPDGKLPSLGVAKALYEACQLAARQAAAERKEKFRVELLGMLRQHLETERGGLEMLITGMCTGDTVNAQQEHLAAIALCIERLDYTPQPAR